MSCFGSDFPVNVIKHSLTRNDGRKKGFIWPYDSRRIESMMGGGGVLQHSGNRKVAGDFFFYTQEAEGENRKWSEAINSQTPPVLPPARLHFLRVPQPLQAASLGAERSNT